MSLLTPHTQTAILFGCGAMMLSFSAHHMARNPELDTPLNPLGINRSPYGEVIAMAAQGPIDTYFHNGSGHEHDHDEHAKHECCHEPGCEHEHAHNLRTHMGHCSPAPWNMMSIHSPPASSASSAVLVCALEGVSWGCCGDSPKSVPWYIYHFYYVVPV